MVSLYSTIKMMHGPINIRFTNIHFWSYLAQFFLEWEMFQTKVAEKIKTHILCSVTFFRKSCRVWDNVEKYCRAWQATDDNMAHAHCTLYTKRYRHTHTHTHTHTHSEHVMLIAFPLQQCFARTRLNITLYVHSFCSSNGECACLSRLATERCIAHTLLPRRIVPTMRRMRLRRF